MISCTMLNIFSLIAIVSAEFYSSLASLKKVIEAKKDIPIIVNGYMEKEIERINYLKKIAQEVEERNIKVARDGEEAMRHPVNAFLLIKGMIADWNKVVKIMRINSADDVIHSVTRQKAINRSNYPTETDLSGVANGLLRLQDTYQLDTRDIANGKILNSQMQTVALTAGDCFEIGRVAYNEYDYYHTIIWMQEARERVENEVIPTASVEDILEYLAFSLYKQGNVKRALLLTDELYRMNPGHPRAKKNIRGYEDLLENNVMQCPDKRRDIPLIINVRHKNDFDEGMMLMYEALCRQEVPADTKVQSRLYCYYKMDSPYLRLAPFKVEIVRQNPLVVLIYDIVTDEETRIIQMLAIPKLNRATVHNVVTGKLETASYRISKSARLRPTEHGIIKRINRRFGLATNLGIETGEDLQVNNYGIGGQYEPHLDCAMISVGSAAILLPSMTEPKIGGQTVFTTNLKLTVKCIKNAALFWYNLMRSGEIDMRSRHAACPVLTGIKWVITKWFHERGQEWHRPCGLNQFAQERYVGDLGAPEPKHLLNTRSETKELNKKFRKH